MGVAEHALRIVWRAHDLQCGGCAGRQLGHDALHLQACCLQGGKGLAQPSFVAHGHQGVAPLACHMGGVRGGDQMQAGGVGEQAFFQQALQDRGQAWAVAAWGQLHRMPRQTAVWHHGHHLARMGGEGGGCPRGVAQHAVAVRVHMGVAVGSVLGGVGQGNDQHKKALIVERPIRARRPSNLGRRAGRRSVLASGFGACAVGP